jgi:hypothetical protein
MYFAHVLHVILSTCTLFMCCLIGSTVVHLHMKCVVLLFCFSKNKTMSAYSKPLVCNIL